MRQNAMKTITIIDAGTANVEIHKLPKKLENAQMEEVEEYYQINGDSEYIFGDLTFSIDKEVADEIIK